VTARQQVSESVLGHLEWENQHLGYCRCPGQDLHSHQTRQRHCRVTLDQVPTIYCFHTSCSAAVESANHRLRSEVGKVERGAQVPAGQTRTVTPEEIAARRKKEAAENLKRRSVKSMAYILDKYEMGPADFWEASPLRLLDGPQDDWKLLLSLFPADDVIWIGAVKDSCTNDRDEAVRARCRRFFRPVHEWLKEPQAPEQFTCASTFHPGVNSRSTENVAVRRFFVVESDILNKDEISAVINWCRSFMRLRAIIDTAGKSLHGWFDPPDGRIIDDLRLILPNLGRIGAEETMDSALFKLPQPCRLPGALRHGKHQALLYLDATP
jgi:hypothetical protein